MQQPPGDRPPWHARRTLWMTVAVVTAVGYVLVGALATGRVFWEFHRGPTKGEIYRAATEEVRERWHNWPVDRVFPGSVPYTSEQGGVESAQRVGVASDTRCSAGIHPATAATLATYRCRALLRATYVDQLQGVVITVGVVAFSDERSAGAAKAALEPGDPTKPAGFLSALPFPGTVAARWSDAARQYASAGQAGPYLVMTVAGQTDGRPAAAMRKKHVEALLLAPEIGDNIAGELARPARPDCSQKEEWTC